jgi:hypothetical protein
MAADTLTTAGPGGDSWRSPGPCPRALLAGTAALAAAGAPAGPAIAAAAPEPDAELLAACARLHVADRAVAAANADPDVEDAKLTRVVREWVDALEAVPDLPATTPAGVRAKAAGVRAAIERIVPIRTGSTVEECAEWHV